MACFEASLSGKSTVTVNWSPDSRWICAGGHDLRLQIWDVANEFSELLLPQIHSFIVTCTAWSPDSETLVSADADGYVMIWDAGDGFRLIASERKHSEAVFRIAWNQQDDRFSTFGWDGRLFMWALDGRELLGSGSYDYDSFFMFALEYSPDGNWLAFGSHGAELAMINTRVRSSRAVHLPFSIAEPRQLAWSPESRYLAIADNAGRLHLLDYYDPAIHSETGQEMIYEMAGSPDGRYIATESFPEFRDRLTLLDTFTGSTTELGELRLPPDNAFSPDGELYLLP